MNLCKNCGTPCPFDDGREECADYKPMTEQQYIQTCTTEALAGAIYEWYSQGHIEGKVGKQLSSVTRVVEWLKEKHDGNVL